MNIQEVEQQIIEEFDLFEDWMDKYNYIIELGKELPLIDPKYKTQQYLIVGCQSQVWLYASYENGIITFTADSDAIITKGIVNLLIRVLSGRTPKEIMEAPLNYLDQIGIKNHLSPTRSNGLASMIKQMKMYAIAFDLKKETDTVKKEVAQSGKPAEFADKMVEGKLKKWYEQVCLLEQPFIKDDSKTIDQLTKELIGKLGENIVIARFSRIEIGAQ